MKVVAIKERGTAYGDMRINTTRYHFTMLSYIRRGASWDEGDNSIILDYPTTKRDDSIQILGQVFKEVDSYASNSTDAEKKAKDAYDAFKRINTDPERIGLAKTIDVFRNNYILFDVYED